MAIEIVKPRPVFSVFFKVAEGSPLWQGELPGLTMRSVIG